MADARREIGCFTCWFAETQFLPIRLSIRLMDKEEVGLLVGILVFSILIGLVVVAVL